MHDLWMFDLAALRWTDLTAATVAHGPAPGYRQRATMVPRDGTLYLFSGLGQEQLLLNGSVPGQPKGLSEFVGSFSMPPP